MFANGRTFRQKIEYETRKIESQSILDRHIDSRPVIVQSRGIEIPRHKYMVPASMPASQFILFLRKKITIKDSDALFTYVEIPGSEDETGVGSVSLIPNSMDMCAVYATYKHSDGFLYVYVERETTFG